MASAIDWTVDKLLTQFQVLDARAEHARNTIQANRVRYMEMLRALPGVADLNAREAIRAKLRDWIHRQVQVENQYRDLAAKWATAKGMVKNFLQSIGITPPAYLGAVVLAPAAVWGVVAAGLGLVAIVIAANTNQTKALDCISNITRAAAQQGWTAAETAKALAACRDAVATTTPDPLGFKGALEAALPLALVVGALLIFAPMLQRKPRAA